MTELGCKPNGSPSTIDAIDESTAAVQPDDAPGVFVAMVALVGRYVSTHPDPCNRHSRAELLDGSAALHARTPGSERTQLELGVERSLATYHERLTRRGARRWQAGAS